MTLKNSFLTSTLENFKRRSWLFALSTLFFFFYFPLVMLVSLQQFTTYTEQESAQMLEQLQTILLEITSFNPITLFFVTIIAVLCALQGFSYLHNRKKVDFYHSLPVSKKKRFCVIYLNGILAFLFPYFLNLCLALAIAATAPLAVTSTFICNAFYSLFLNLLCFLAIYNIAIIAVMLTGRGVIAALAIVVLMLYEFLIKVLVSLYSSEYFKTFNSYEEPFRNNITSPLFYVADKLDSVFIQSNSILETWAVMTELIPTLLIYTVFYALIAYVLYCKRPSEASGKAIAFVVAKPIIKLCLVIPCSLLSAIFFKSITDGSFTFLILGMLIGLFLSHCLLEIVYEFDLRAAFHNGKHLLLSLVIIVLFYSVFHFDLIRYDQYFPKASQLESTAVMIVHVDDNYYDVSSADFNHIYWREYQSVHMNITDVSLIQELVQSSPDFTKEDDPSNDMNAMQLNLVYKLKDGSKKNRAYMLDMTSNAQLLDRLFITEEFKTGLYQLYDDSLFSADNMRHFDTSYTNGTQNSQMTPQQAGELLEIYKQNLIHLTNTQRIEEVPIGFLRFSSLDKQNQLFWSYPVYSSFTETIQYLKNHELFLSSTLDPDTIYSIVVINEDDSSITKTYTDRQSISKIVNALYPSNLYHEISYGYDQIYHRISVRINFKEENVQTSTDNYTTQQYFFITKFTPDFVLTDIISKIKE